MRWIAALALLAFFAPQDKKCDQKKTEEGSYCVKCKKILFKTDKLDLFDKDGNCKECKEKPEKVTVCLKEWIPSCGMCQTAHEAGGACCKSKQCCKVEVVRSLVLWKCEPCGESGRTKEGIQHTKKHPEAELVKTCEKNGSYPHGGELPKKEK